MNKDSTNENGPELGIVIGKTKPEQITFESKRPVSIGEYIILHYAAGKVLGLIERSSISSDALGDGIRNFQEASESKQVAVENKRDKSYKGFVRILGYLHELKKCKAVIPELPPEPGTVVYEATKQDLATIFSPSGDAWLRIGSLLRNSEVDAKINIDKVVSRHLAILAMTGMGKSNLVSLLAKEISKISGTVVIFDYHDDYSTLEMKNVNLMDARINPRRLSSDKLAQIMEIADNADKQKHVLRDSFSEEVKQRQGDDFWNALVNAADGFSGDKIYRESAARLVDKITDARRKLSNILDPSLADPLHLIKNGRVNVINLTELTETQANVIVSYYLEEMLEDRKKATAQKKDPDAYGPPIFPAPILVVIEEAHVFVPKDDDTDTKYFAAKVAREGRKFGLGLVIVSQRPRGIDSNILSQMGSLAVMRIVQQDDQMQVSAASEALSKELIEQLPSLNPGEAVFAGQWVNLPAFVRADEVKERKIGGDQHAAEEWKKLAGIKEMIKAPEESFIPDGYVQD